MGVMPVGKLLFSMSLPIMISMLVQALYNVVDSMFVARVSENALTALSMAFPIQNLMIAVSAGLGVGLNAVLSRALCSAAFWRSTSAAAARRSSSASPERWRARISLIDPKSSFWVAISA